MIKLFRPRLELSDTQVPMQSCYGVAQAFACIHEMRAPVSTRLSRARRSPRACEKAKRGPHHSKLASSSAETMFSAITCSKPDTDRKILGARVQLARTGVADLGGRKALCRCRPVIFLSPFCLCRTDIGAIFVRSQESSAIY